LRRQLNTVVKTVAYQVGDRISDAFDQPFVEFGLLADGDQLNLFAELGRQVAYQARKALKT
jgi:hypothetical protein